MSALRTLVAKRYVQPLREGGSLPAIVDTDDGLFVAKFRGAGQGPRALVAELVVGALARAVGLPVPDLVLLEVLPIFGRTEPDPEIQDLLRASHGLNVGMRYLDGAFNYDGFAAGNFITNDFAADVVWFDAFVTNPDRTHRNPNMMVCNRELFLIDHGAALYAQHNWVTVDEARARAPFALIKDHVLLLHAGDMAAADIRLASLITRQLVEDIVSAVPTEIMADEPRRYIDYLMTRVASPRAFVDEAITAQREAVANPPRRKSARR